jgi:hypothetical protein
MIGPERAKGKIKRVIKKKLELSDPGGGSRKVSLAGVPELIFFFAGARRPPF